MLAVADRVESASSSQPSTSSVTPGLPRPNGASRAELLAERQPELRARRRSRRPRSRGRRSSSVEHRVGVRARTPRRTRRRARAGSSGPAAARWPPKRSRCSAHAASAPCRSNGRRRRGPSPSSCRPCRRSARPAGRSARRAARRRSRSRPRASPRRRRRSRGGGGAPRATPRSRRSPRAGSAPRRACRSRFSSSSSSASRVASRGVVGQQQLERRLGPAEPAGGVDPRREPEADRALVAGGRVDARDAHQRPQAGLLRLREPAQARAARARGSRRRAARRRRRSRARRRRGAARGTGGPGRAAPRRASRRRRCRRGPANGIVALERRDDRAVRERVAGPVVVGDDDARARARAPRATSATAVMPQSTVSTRSTPVGGEPRERLAREAVALLEARRQVPGRARRRARAAGSTASAVAQMPSAS